MIPVIWGWIAVGTQQGPNSIDKALDDETRHTWRMSDHGLLEERQQGIFVRSGLNPLPKSHQQQPSPSTQSSLRKSESQLGTSLRQRRAWNSSPGTSETVLQLEDKFDGYVDREEVPILLGLDVRGDEARQGPIYNHARLFTWSQSARKIIHGFQSTVENIRNHQDCQGNHWEPHVHCKMELSGDAAELAEYTELPLNRPLPAYPEFRSRQPHVWWHSIIAGFLAMFVQWGTTGSAVLIAYLTPTVGLGCRSGGLLLYGVVATVVWMLLVASALFSHRAMLMYQELHRKSPSPDLFQSRIALHPRSSRHTLICALAIGTRLLGKTLAFVNTIWIITAALFEYIGVYNTCWCQILSVTKGGKGYVVLFASVHELADATLSAWSAGIALSVMVCLVALDFFILLCKDDGDE